MYYRGVVKVLRPTTAYYLVLVGNLEEVALNTRLKENYNKTRPLNPQLTVWFHKMCVGN